MLKCHEAFRCQFCRSGLIWKLFNLYVVLRNILKSTDSRKESCQLSAAAVTPFLRSGSPACSGVPSMCDLLINLVLPGQQGLTRAAHLPASLCISTVSTLHVSATSLDTPHPCQHTPYSFSHLGRLPSPVWDVVGAQAPSFTDEPIP